MRFTSAGFAHDEEGLVLGYEAEVLEVLEVFDIEAGLEVPVKAFEGHVPGKAGFADALLKRSGLPCLQLGREQAGKKIEMPLALALCGFEDLLKILGHVTEIQSAKVLFDLFKDRWGHVAALPRYGRFRPGADRRIADLGFPRHRIAASF